MRVCWLESKWWGRQGAWCDINGKCWMGEEKECPEATGIVMREAKDDRNFE